MGIVFTTESALAETSDTVSVQFNRGSALIDLQMADNHSRLENFIKVIEHALTSDTLMLTSITFSGSASPEGGMQLNRRLAGKRLAALEKYIRSRVDIPDSIIIRRNNGANWDGLAAMVAASDAQWRDSVLYHIYNTPEQSFSGGRPTDSRRKRLINMHSGRVWREMESLCFPDLRNACIVAGTTALTPSAPVEKFVSETPVTAVRDDSREVAAPATIAASVMPTPSKPFYMSLQTNMLYDVLALPNIGIELHLGKNWSIAANWIYGWWSCKDRHRYWRAYGGDIAVRRWFGRAASHKPLTGHHIGLYGQILTYDIEFGGKGQMAGAPGKTLWYKPTYAAGIEYGYTLPLARRLNIDFTIGVGYLSGDYYKYQPIDNHYVWMSTSKRKWLGPTKLEVSLVWLLGNGNFNAGKGGAQ